ncbi:conserved protein of unknown function [Rhodovastum atsumiense]|uniref:YncE family protein n=1 Tax=Rhodovastum atsumiense TaxID=504468 RepID=A0A5M6IKX3_9PROT|nr:hypothetical protein [Rhodovastum atsumiense]KAA5608567.1 hypothetical protein F1189_28455 [Rhodovastum atsumiense]CAH2598793.1 conserved protein of unknown function [Rhodovastum atsumiense]
MSSTLITNPSRSHGRRDLLALAAAELLALAGPAAPARGAGPGSAGFGEVARLVFVPQARSQRVEVLDADSDQRIGGLSLGLTPHQVEVSAGVARLVAIDGSSPDLLLLDLVTTTSRRIPLSVAARRLVLSPDGMTAAVADSEAGSVAFVDLLFGRESGVVRDLPPLRDIIFAGRQPMFVYAPAGRHELGLIDAVTTLPAGPIATPQPVTELRRAPNGRRLFAHGEGGGPVSVIDLEAERVINDIPAGAGSLVLPSATGARLLLLEPQAARVSVLDADGSGRVALAGAGGLDAAYPAWLDSVAFVPSATERCLLVYDLDEPRLAGRIALGGLPLRGSVTPDGQKLFLPLGGTREVLVIDARRRAVLRRVRLDDEPQAALIAGGYGICH